MIDYLVAEADADAEHDAAEDEHYQVGGGGVEGGADEEADAATDDAGAAAVAPRDGGGGEGGDEAGKVEGGGERGEALVVILAVIALRLEVLLPVHRREELLQEGVHRGHPPCNQFHGDHRFRGRKFRGRAERKGKPYRRCRCRSRRWIRRLPPPRRP